VSPDGDGLPEPSLADELVAVAARVVFERGEPGSGARMRDRHGRDRSGRCAGCSQAGTVAPRYPCRLRLIGEVAAGLERLVVETHGVDDGAG